MSPSDEADFENALGHLHERAHAHAEQNGLDTEVVARLRDAVTAEMAALTYARERAVRSADQTSEWYGARIERLRVLGQEKGIWPEMADIIANGTLTSADPLNFSRQINVAKMRAQEAERRLGYAEDRARQAESEVRALRRELALAQDRLRIRARAAASGQ